MVSLAQLNQHLDDEHNEEEDPAELLLNWFRKTQRRVISPFSRAAKTATTNTLANLNLNIVDKLNLENVKAVIPGA
ncbi:hypothetical protein HK102_005816, partial [Quaeritorhiza haematococci]